MEPYNMVIQACKWLTLHKKCPYSELFQSVFSRIRTEYGELPSISPYSVGMRENANKDTFYAV